ncbi:hypothetical protein L2E82_41660 [Cichorium intybus]|uniref:Uncharacterized protein n=1 Tax=Cichorium intybus TaxID=13427 RepID=A0ACB8ZL40_CICIN|nr:hypothetical protein L2E82_41660 [Cichorium intybus]
MDRISDLPDPIVHHIMSFLTTLDLTKISILSKRFFLLWSSFPVIDFDESTFGRSSQGIFASMTDEFLDHIHNSIRLRKIDTVISEFRVKANLKGIPADHRLDSAISFALENGVKLLDLNLGFSKYQFPVSFASRSINVLRLIGLNLDCQNIAYLSLNNVVNGHDWVEEHTSTLGKLETFILNGCQDIDSIRVCNERVERVEIGNCPLLTSVEVIAPSLESFEYKGIADRQRVSNISFIASKSIKDLYIENADITDEWLETELNTLCCLESLRLKACNSLKQIVVIHEKLQILEFLNCLHMEEAEIDTPQLVSFVYLGNMIEFGKLVTRSICTATLFINPWITYNNEYSSFYGWRKLLSFFGHCKVLKLICSSQKFAYDEMVKEEEDKNPFCCTSKPVKCWRHNLKRLDIHTTDVSSKNGSVELQKYFLTNAMMLDSLSFTNG